MQTKREEIEKEKSAVSGVIDAEKQRLELEVSEQKKALEKDFSPISDMRASRLYRMEVATSLLEKVCVEIKQKKLIGLYA